MVRRRAAGNGPDTRSLPATEIRSFRSDVGEEHMSTTTHSRSRALAVRLRDDAGLTTAEYAVGTIAAAGLGGLLLKLLTSPQVRDLLWSLISSAFGSILG